VSVCGFGSQRFFRTPSGERKKPRGHIIFITIGDEKHENGIDDDTG
jgi:hypothetical protein